MDSPILLSDNIEHINVLLMDFFERPPYDLRSAVQKRLAHSLHCLNRTWSPKWADVYAQFRADNRSWTRLDRVLRFIDQLDVEIDVLSRQAKDLENRLGGWKNLSPHDKELFRQKGTKACEYVRGSVSNRESVIFDRYERLQTLRPLLPWAQNSEHIIRAIDNVQRREQNELNIAKLDKQIEQCRMEIEKIDRGIHVASVLLVTVVLAVFSGIMLWSLWNKKKDEVKKRDRSVTLRERLKAAVIGSDEGVIYMREIQEALQDPGMDANEICGLLQECRDLSYEFNQSDTHSSDTAQLLSFLDLNRSTLETLFQASAPKSPRKAIEWLAFHMEQILSLEANLREKNKRIDTLSADRSQHLGKYSYEQVSQQLQVLKVRILNVLPADVSSQHWSHYIRISSEMMNILTQVQLMLEKVYTEGFHQKERWGQLGTELHNIKERLERMLQKSDGSVQNIEPTSVWSSSEDTTMTMTLDLAMSRSQGVV